MRNNYWEEQHMSINILDFHESLMSKMGLSKWIKDIKCPFCEKEIPLRSIRNIQFCFNTRNFGEIAIEVLCEDCAQMDTLYFRMNCKNINDFIEKLSPKEELDILKIDPILEKNMYEMQYNNVAEEMFTNGGKMGFIKKNTVSSVVVVASSVYSCTECDYTEIMKDEDIDENKKCPKCEAHMKIIASSIGNEDEDEDEDSTTDKE